MDSDSSFHSPSSSNEQQQEQEDDESEHETTVQNPNSIDTSLDAIENQLSSISFNTPVNETPVDYTHETGGEMMIHTDSVDENSYSRLWNNNIEVNDGSLTENNRETIINKDHVSEINDGSLTENNGETIINEGFIGESSNIEVNDGSLTENNGETVNNRSSVGESGYLRESEVNEGSLTESGRETVTNRGSVGESGYLWGNNINVEGEGEGESPSSSGYAGEGGSSGTGSVTSGGCGADVIQEVNGVDSVDDSQAEGGGGKRHADEDDASISWRKRKKHFFILSHSGKPIYSRYGDEHKLAGFSATLQAIISFVENGGDRVKLVRAGKHQVVFLVKGPIYLVCISCTEEPYESLRGQLELLYGQMILILTRSVDRCFEKNSKFDMTPLLGGTEAVFSSLIHSFSLNPATFLHAYTCLPLAYATRQAAGAILQDVADTGVVFAILMCKDKVISLVGLQKASLHPDDMLLLANFVISSESFRTSESFSPICLPRYNPMAFLYAYVHYLDVDTYLILLTASSQAFFHLKECRIRIETVLSKSNVLNEVQRSMSEGGMRIDDLPVDPSARSRSLFHSNQRRPPESVVGIGGPAGLLHFIYRSIYLDQYVSSEFASPISTPQQQKRLYRAYQRLYASMHDKWVGPHKTQFRRDENYVLLCWVTQDFELYAAFDPLADKSVAIRICNRVCQWVKDVENEIFLLGASPFSW